MAHNEDIYKSRTKTCKNYFYCRLLLILVSLFKTAQSMEIQIIHKAFSLKAHLNDSGTANLFKTTLPIDGTVTVWGGEIYFEVPVTAEEDTDAQKVVNEGDLAFWPPGNAFCIFFGPTPVSQGKMPEAYSKVNVIGKIEGDINLLKNVSEGDHLKVVRNQTI